MSDYPTSYTPPSPGEVIDYPYVAVKGGIYDGLKPNLVSNSIEAEQKFITEAGREISGLIAPFLQLLKNTMLSEKAKEEEFLNKFSSQMPDSQLKNEVLNFIQNNNFSLAYDALQNWKDNLYDVTKNFADNINSYNKWISKYRNKVINQAITDLRDDGVAALSNINLNTPIDSIINLIIDRIIETSIVDNNELQKYKEVLHQAMDDLTENFVTGGWKLPSINTTLQDIKQSLEQGTASSDLKKKFKGDKSNRSIMDACLSYISGFTNGLSMEAYLEIFGGGSSSARFMSNINSLSGNNNSTGAMETDVFSIYNANFEYILPEFNTIEGNTEEDIKRRLEEVAPNDSFIIHYSVKDYTNASIKIKGSGSFDVRLENISRLGKAVSLDQIKQLIFAIANSADDMVMGGSIEEIKACISSMCYIYMFEDFENFVNFEFEPPKIKQSSGPNHLHIYFINGHYITMSDMLKTILQDIELSLQKYFVKGGKWTGGLVQSPSVKTPPSGIYNKVSKDSSLQGIPKWNEVRNQSLAKGNFDVQLSLAKLNEIITIKY